MIKKYQKKIITIKMKVKCSLNLSQSKTISMCIYEIKYIYFTEIYL